MHNGTAVRLNGLKMNITRRKINKDYGERCEEYTPLCAVCEIHRALDLFEMLYEFGDWK